MENRKQIVQEMYEWIKYYQVSLCVPEDGDTHKLFAKN